MLPGLRLLLRSSLIFRALSTGTPNNNNHLGDQWHSYSGWEIHPLTAWRISSTSPPLSASFSYSPSSPQTSQQVTFTGSASGGTAPYVFSWIFGDGSTGTGSTVSHAYSTAGSYAVVLTVRDSSSPQQTVTSQQSVTVTSSPLSASFTVSPSSPDAGQAVSFSGSASGGFLHTATPGASAMVEPVQEAR